MVPASLLALALSVVNASRTAAQSTAGARTIHSIDAAGMDRSVKPGDDFFKYANGVWERETPIPADRPAWGISAELDEESTRQTRALLEEAAASRAPKTADERKAGDYYAAFMNDAAIEKRSRPIADIEEGHISTATCILANMAMDLGRPLVYDPKKRVIVDDRDATKHLVKAYRKPWKHPAA